MALTSCWRCARQLPIRVFLNPARPIIPSTTPIPATTLLRPRQQSTPFSSTIPQNAALVKKKTTLPMSNPKAKGSTTLIIKKKGPPVKASRPADVGARRAERKRLVLANANALEVGLPALSARIAKEDKVNGTMFSFEGSMIDTLRTLEGFQAKQGWEFFHTPSTLVREESIELGKLLAWVNGEEVQPKSAPKEKKPVEQEAQVQQEEQEGQEGQENQKGNVQEEAQVDQEAHVEGWVPTGGYVTTPEVIPEVEIRDQRLQKLAGESRSGRRVITGPRGAGKSVLLTQVMAWAHQRKWVVLTIPNAQDLVIGHTEYEHDLGTDLWLQKPYIMALLQRFLRANATVLKATRLSRDHVFGRDVIPQKDSLYILTELGALDVGLSWDVFNAILYELSLPGRPPVLFTLDNLNYISLPSNYRAPDFTPIHAHDLALPNIFLSYLRGERTFWRGLTLASTTARSPAAPALAYALAGEEPSPYKKIDPRIAPSIKGAPVMLVSPLTKPQAKVLMEYYRDSGLYNQDVQSTLAEKWVLSSGIPKELLKACLRLKY